MFCPTCGKECADAGMFCPNCGSAITQAQRAAPSPTPTPVAFTAPVQIMPASAKQKQAAVLLALVAFFALFIGIINTFSMVELPVSVSADLSIPSPFETGHSSSNTFISAATTKKLDITGKIVAFDSSLDLLSNGSDVLEQATDGELELSLESCYIGLILFGIVNLAIAAYGILYYIHIRTGKCNIFGFLKGKSPMLWVGLIGVAAAIFQILMMASAGLDEELYNQALSLEIGVHWSTWLCLIIYGGLAGYELLRLDKNDE